jgi:hypothetical protein
MRKVLFAALAIATCVMAGKSTNKHGPQRTYDYVESSEKMTCSKACGVELGRCLVEEKDVDACMKKAGQCGHTCIFGEKKEPSVMQYEDMGKCQANCGIDYGKCMITTFAVEDCLKQEAACALDCLKQVVVENTEVSEVENV